MLAHGAMYGAYMNVVVNTRLMKDKEYAENLNAEAKTILDTASKEALQVYDDVIGRLTNG
jgi:formiminotetrahydrofolate cyclodeaminase